MEREVFPRILSKGMYGLRFDGYWVDCGTRENLLAAFRTLMRGGVMDDRTPAPAVIEDRAQVEGAIIGPSSYISSGASVGRSTKIENSVVYQDATIGSGCTISNSIVDVGTAIPDNAEVRDVIVSAVESPPPD